MVEESAHPDIEGDSAAEEAQIKSRSFVLQFLGGLLERILKVTQHPGNRGRWRKLSL